MSNRLIVLILVVISMILLLVGEADYKDQLAQQVHYCNMIAKWHEFEHLPPEERPGWPPYKGECDGNQ